MLAGANLDIVIDACPICMPLHTHTSTSVKQKIHVYNFHLSITHNQKSYFQISIYGMC